MKRICLTILAVLAVAVILAGAALPDGQTIRLKTADGSQLPLFERASDLSPVVTYIQDGEAVLVLETTEEWYKVRTQEDAVGWVPR